MLRKRACDLCYSKKSTKRSPKPRIENSVFAIEQSLSSQLEPIDFVLDRVMLEQGTSVTTCLPWVEEFLPGLGDIFCREASEQDVFLSSIPLTCNSTGDEVDCLDRETAWRALDAYPESSVRFVHPLMDPVIFRDTLELAFSLEETPRRTAAQASVLALVSTMGFFDDRALSLPRSLEMKCASRAVFLLESTNGIANLMSLRAISLLRFQSAFSGQIPASVRMHQIACRLVTELGGHNMRPEAGVNYNETEIRELRSLFWESYITDKATTLRTGIEPCLPDNLCDLTPPGHLSPSLGCFNEGRMPPPPYGVLPPCLMGDIQLSILKSRIWQLLYSNEARQRSEAELLRAVRELDGELEAWRMCVPEEIRPTFLVADRSRISTLEELDLSPWVRHHGTSLHLEYHNLFITIHQASARYQFSKGSDSLGQAWGTSVQSNRVDQCNYRVSIHYPVVALRTLFVNIAANPSGPDAESDLRLLCSTSDLIKRMPMSEKMVGGQEYIQKMEEDVSELVQYVQSLTG
ncbi:uncharacterized protein NECHADRAFT_84447 [Fusarium vanettenii 77-13-4]|uniref:Xylanolytic transcriptional activator regulatory domain-containing protein n=1 Tax=Fusarium vanettenii (strain ATCC MYA-4622 / CBS 123669 / FGSC 9596 / NRRL 45880 / 77-13-4) TaxID=660122 RepID=C7ZD50_FUSV7|nr:uncharacterized protein NECHADRAFT_84447 [Fusarium vanettenii 77-13-4]EEU38160.1 hypothetical protein NECHADRAFT_84447 [Fusarium vanettenii 77-13-4]